MAYQPAGSFLVRQMARRPRARRGLTGAAARAGSPAILDHMGLTCSAGGSAGAAGWPAVAGALAGGGNVPSVVES